MTEKDFTSKPYKTLPEHGIITWEAPSNIALVKYWGKKTNQIPENPSLSFTLSRCKTITTLSYSIKEDNSGFAFEVFLDGEKKDSFKPKIETFFKRIEPYLPFLKAYTFKIETTNTFPHSSGIASSASGMSALALCLLSIEKMIHPEMTADFFTKKASFLARLGSGSACRSVEGSLIVWGKTKTIKDSTDLFGTKYPYKVHDNFNNYQDTILLVDKGEKQVSSTLGHKLMHNHPFAKTRFKQAHENLEKLKGILENGDLNQFIEVMESEALTLHAMMMTGFPYFILMKPNTLEIINKIWKYRQDTGLPVGFTLDAGANVHVLYPEEHTKPVLKFIKNELVAYCQNEQYICDQIGLGANQL
ncbi:MAG TPA: diphosphomevalonate decarboxylase [Flavobacteriaceae bacterium]|nr:diphosphomevalonate decarboxylase [Flavobacteriaceae bacterium]